MVSKKVINAKGINKARGDGGRKYGGRDITILNRIVRGNVTEKVTFG